MGRAATENQRCQWQHRSLPTLVSMDLVPLLTDEAKARQATSAGGAKTQLTEKIPEAGKGEARVQAAKIVGVNPHYVSDVALSAV